MNEDADFVREYARVRLALSQGRREILKVCGHDESSLRKLEANALAQLSGTDSVETEFGRVIVDRSPIYQHKDSKQIAEKERLRLINKEN